MDKITITAINEILNEWATKLGTTVEKLIPEMQKYYIVQYMVTVLAWLTILVVMLIIGKRLIKKHIELENEKTDYDDLNIWGYVVWGFSIIPFILFCYFTVTLFQWIVSPSAALIDKLMQLIVSR